jgi:hypothetical protein
VPGVPPGYDPAVHELTLPLVTEPVLGHGPGRLILDRPGVVNMVRAGDAWGLDKALPEELLAAGEAFRRDPHDIIATYEDEPYHYWRLCRITGEVEPTVTPDLIAVRPTACNGLNQGRMYPDTDCGGG